LQQDRSRWDQLLIQRGLAALARGEALSARGPYLIQAAITACHARAREPDETDWAKIAELYGELARVMPSPVVELNRAVAGPMAEGPEAGLRLVDAPAAEPPLRDYPLLPGARADLLVRLGRLDEAQAEFERAAAMTQNVRHRERLLERAAECGRSVTGRESSR